MVRAGRRARSKSEVELTMEKERLTFCRICEPMCGLKVRVEENRVLGIQGDREHPLSRGWICKRGAAFAEIHNDPDRLRHPLRKGPDGMERIAWKQAVGEVAARLGKIRNRYGPESIALYMGNPMAFCTYGTLALPAFARALGTPHFFTSGSQDCNNKFVAAQQVLGSPVLQPIPDLDHVGYLLLIGGNPLVSGMSFIQVPRPAETLLNIRRRGGEIVVVDPRRTETAKIATKHLFIQPDTDFFFLLSLLCVLVREGLWDRRWAEEDLGGFAALRELVDRWPPERTEPITGIPCEETRQIARRLAGPEPAAAYGSIGISLGRTGTLNYWLLLVLNILSGHFDRKGGSLLCRGVMDSEQLYRLSGMEKVRGQSRIGGFRSVMGTYPAALLSHEILNDRDKRIRALVVVAGNPLLSIPGESRLREAFERLELLVCLDLYQNETGAFAHYLFPTTDFLEREDLDLSHVGLQLRRHAVYTSAVVEPDAEQLPEWQILQRISDEMGLPLWGKLLDPLLKAAARMPGAGRIGGKEAGKVPVPRLILKLLFRIFGEVDFSTLESAPRGVVLGPHEYGRFGRQKARWRRGPKIHLSPAEFLREAWRMEERLAARKSETAEFLLIGKRERHTHNTWMHNSPKLLGKETTNYAYLHPEDAVEKGIRDGDWVRIKGLDGGELRAPCRLSADLKRKVVALPHGWGHVYAAGWHHARERSGVNVNVLASDAVWRLESFAGMTWMNGIPVDVEPVRPAKRKKRKSGSGAPGDGG